MYEASFNYMTWDDLSSTGGVDFNPHIFENYAFSPKALDTTNNHSEFPFHKGNFDSYINDLDHDYSYKSSNESTDGASDTYSNDTKAFSDNSTPSFTTKSVNNEYLFDDNSSNILSSDPRMSDIAFSSALDVYLSNLANMHSNDFRFDSPNTKNMNQKLESCHNFELDEFPISTTDMSSTSLLKPSELHQENISSCQSKLNGVDSVDISKVFNLYQDKVSKLSPLSPCATSPGFWAPSEKEGVDQRSVSACAHTNLTSTGNGKSASVTYPSLTEISPVSVESSFSSPCSMGSQLQFSPISSVSGNSSPAFLSFSSTSLPGLVSSYTKPTAVSSFPNLPMLRKQNESRLSLPNLYILMGLGTDHEEASLRESKILDMLKSRGFKLGEQTWIRDTTEAFRKDILDWIYNETFDNFGYDKDLIEIIIKRNCYYVMQGKLRKIRRSKRRRDSMLLNNSLSV